MVSKRALLASSAFLLVGTGTASADGLYLNIFAGANLQNDISGAQGTTTTFTNYFGDDQGGFVIGGTVGMPLDFAKGFRLEGEFSWRDNDANGRFAAASSLIGTSSGILETSVSTFSLLANLWYDIDFGGKLVPYVGGGVGWGWSKAEGTFYRTTPATGTPYAYDVDDSGFVWQLGAGLQYPIQDGMKLGLGYRYFRGPEIDNNVFIGKNDLPVEHARDNHSITLDMTFDLN